MSRSRLLACTAFVVLLLGACGGNGTRDEVFSCVGPYLDSVPPGASEVKADSPVSPGDSVTVYGHLFTGTCGDTGGNNLLEPPPPVHLTVTWPGGDTERLGTVTPDGADGGFSVVVHVPAGTPAGVARIRDDERDATAYRFHVG